MSQDRSKIKDEQLKQEGDHFTEDSHVPELQTLNPEHQTEDMEVHKHPHHITHKKKWGEYLLEFFMLFFAVFLGFLAEYQLEHTIERDREEKYIISYIEDLKADTLFINQYLANKAQKKNEHDSLIWYLNSPNPNQYGQRIYFFARRLTRTMAFFPTDGTIKQLKYSGGLRLIKKQQVIDSIMTYDLEVEKIMLTQSRQEREVADIRPMMGVLMDPNILETMVDGEIIIPPAGNPALRTVDRKFILDFIYAIHQLKGSDGVNVSRLRQLKKRATGIILFSKNEYHLE